MGISDNQLYQILVENQFLNQEDLNKIRQNAFIQEGSFYEALLRSDLISDENLGKLIADYLHLPFVTLSKFTIPEAYLRITPKDIALKFKVITYGVDQNYLKIATTNPNTRDLFDYLTKKAGASGFHIYYATDRDIEEALELYKIQLDKVFAEILTTRTEDENSVVKIVDKIIEYAYLAKASDIHIEPHKTSCLVRFRIDGMLKDVVKLPKQLHEQIVSRIKVLAELRTDEHLAAQDGKMKVALDSEDLDIRVSIVPASGENVVLRLLSSHFRQFGLTDLGMREEDLAKVRSGFSKPYGMILSTGPTGSGKTTTMYSILKILNTRDRHIATIEDPVEYDVEGLTQIKVNAKTELTFANGLRSILRQDPDVIYVGEIRDEETADIAINSATTGHLVLSTLHTNDSATTLPRLIDMGIEPFLIASTVNVIVGQRLVRKICDKCRISIEIYKEGGAWFNQDKSISILSNINQGLVAKRFGGDNTRVYKGKGCSVCRQSGYVGRVGVFEVLVVSPKIQSLIIQKADSAQILHQAASEGMTTMLEDGLFKIQNGITTIEEILRVTKE